MLKQSIVLASPILSSQRKQVVDLAVKNRLPTIYYRSDFVEDGGLMSYGVSLNDLARRAATYVDKILKGSQARRSSRGAADQVRVHRQFESGEADRSNDPAECVGAGGSGDQMKKATGNGRGG